MIHLKESDGAHEFLAIMSSLSLSFSFFLEIIQSCVSRIRPRDQKRYPYNFTFFWRTQHNTQDRRKIPSSLPIFTTSKTTTTTAAIWPTTSLVLTFTQNLLMKKIYLPIVEWRLMNASQPFMKLAKVRFFFCPTPSVYPYHDSSNLFPFCFPISNH